MLLLVCLYEKIDSLKVIRHETKIFLLDEIIYILYIDHYSLQKYMEHFLDQIYFVLCPKCKENIFSKKYKEMNK